MRNKFKIKEIMIKGKDTDKSIVESDWIITIDDITIQAESHYFEEHRGIKDPKDFTNKIGNCQVSLLFNNDIEIKNNDKKDVGQIQGNNYKLEGEVVKVEKKQERLDNKLLEWNEIFVDCGFIFKTSTKKDVKKGDYVICEDNLILENVQIENQEKKQTDLSEKSKHKIELPRFENHNIKVIGNNKKFEAELVVDQDKKRLTIKFNDKEYSIDYNKNHYQTLRDLDRKLNKDGFKILCNGTSKNVFCAGFCLTMANGEQVRYTTPDGEIKLKETYAYEEWNEYATQEEQVEYYRGAKK
ncbi:MAG: hypothetical protein ABIJ08_03985 [Nanoarchaeota archaeon]